MDARTVRAQTAATGSASYPNGGLPGLEPGEGMERASIPAGRCARLRLVGLSDDLEAPATWLYRSWLPGSGETLRDFPLFCERSNFGPGMPEGEMVTDLYLPLA